MMTSPAREQFVNDLQAVVKDAEVLLQNSAAPLSNEFKSAKERFEKTLKNAKDEAMRIEKLLVSKTKEAIHSTDHYVKEKPWHAVGFSAAVGLAIGMLIARK